MLFSKKNSALVFAMSLLSTQSSATIFTVSSHIEQSTVSSINAEDTVVYTTGSSFTGHAGTEVHNYGDIFLNDGTAILYEAGSSYTSYAGSYAVNNIDVINHGIFDIQAGSIVDGTGSFTQEDGGTIIVNGTVTIGSVNILGSGYLGGSGTINGNVYAAGSDVIINSGNSPGTLTVNGDLTVEDGAQIILEVGSLGHDTLQVSGDFNLEDGTDIVFKFLDGFDETILENFELTDFFEVTSNGANNLEPTLDLALFSTMNFGFQSITNEVVTLNLGTDGRITQVSEPTTFALLLLGLSGLVVQRKRLDS